MGSLLTLRVSSQGVLGEADLPDNVVPAGGWRGSQSWAVLCGSPGPPPTQLRAPVRSREVGTSHFRGLLGSMTFLHMDQPVCPQIRHFLPHIPTRTQHTSACDTTRAHI